MKSLVFAPLFGLCLLWPSLSEAQLPAASFNNDYSIERESGASGIYVAKVQKKDISRAALINLLDSELPLAQQKALIEVVDDPEIQTIQALKQKLQEMRGPWIRVAHSDRSKVVAFLDVVSGRYKERGASPESDFLRDLQTQHITLQEVASGFSACCENKRKCFEDMKRLGVLAKLSMFTFKQRGEERFSIPLFANKLDKSLVLHAASPTPFSSNPKRVSEELFVNEGGLFAKNGTTSRLDELRYQKESLQSLISNDRLPLVYSMFRAGPKPVNRDEEMACYIYKLAVEAGSAPTPPEAPTNQKWGIPKHVETPRGSDWILPGPVRSY